MKKILSLLIIFITGVFMLTSCNFNNSGKVNIKSLKASTNMPTETIKSKKSELKKLSLTIKDEDAENPLEILDETNDYIPDAQYIIIYKNEYEISFTINLSNPKGEAIDAVQLKCDDVNACVKADGSWEKLSQSPDGYVVNWASENAYKKTYYLKTTSIDDINTITVVDLKINGQWQNKQLSNDKLTVYKMNENDLSWNFEKNYFTYYKWKFTYDDNIITNLKAYNNDGAQLTCEDGSYTTDVCGIVRYEYDYTYNGTTVHWSETRNIQFLKFTYYDNSLNPYVRYLDNKDFAIVGIYISGTDVDKISFSINGFNAVYLKNTYGVPIFEAINLTEASLGDTFKLYANELEILSIDYK